MNEADALGLIQSTIWTIVVASGPAVATAMVVGIIIALFQALTQIQEMTLTFVPKIIAVMLVLSLTALLHRLAIVHLHRTGLRQDRTRLLSRGSPAASPRSQ